METTLAQSQIIIQARNAGPSTPSFSATIVNVGADRLTLLFESPITLSPKDLISVSYQDPGTERYLRAQGVILNAVINTLKPIYEIAITSAFVHSERRKSYRVPAVAAKIGFLVANDPFCDIIDISPHGVSVTTASEFTIGSIVPIAGHFEQSKFVGNARICSIVPHSKGRSRLGLEIPVSETHCRQWLQEISTLLQRRQLQRRGGISTNKPLNDLQSADVSAPDGFDNDESTKLPTELKYLTVQIPIAYLLSHPLPGTIWDDAGTIVAKPGKKLTADEILGLIESPIIIGEDWWVKTRKAPATTTITSTEHKAVPPSPYDELRSFQRTQWETTAIVRLLEEHDKRELEVTTSDLSQGGMAFYSRSYLHVGTKLAVTVNGEGNSYETRGRVVSCVYEPDSGGTHRIGVQFTRSALEADDSFPTPNRAAG